MNELKAISHTENELRVGNYMVLFGGRDLAGEFFTKNTNFKSNYTDIGTLYVDFEHGLDPDSIGNSDSNVLGVVDWKSAKVDDTGIYVERILNRRASYMEFLSDLINAGVVGTSSASVRGKSVKKNDGEIIEWPLMRDSLTVTPMEPRMVGSNVLQAAKSLVEIFPHNKSLAIICGLPVINPDPRIKSIELINDLKGAEQCLRDVGMTHTESKAFISRLKSLGPRDADEGGMQQLFQALKSRDVFQAA